MNEIIESDRFNFRRFDNGKVKHFEKANLDLTAGVVCKSCNSGHMSQLEQYKARPALKELIANKQPKFLTPKDCAAIAAFAFKVTVIASRMIQDREEIFSENIRYNFAKTLTTPEGFRVWLACRSSMFRTTGVFRSTYLDHRKPRYGFKGYTCTFGIGNVLLQAIYASWTNPATRAILEPPAFTSHSFTDGYTVEIWPNAPVRAAWPPRLQIGDELIEKFIERWDKVDISSRMVE